MEGSVSARICLSIPTPMDKQALSGVQAAAKYLVPLPIAHDFGIFFASVLLEFI
jgi:hypothetical protein